MTPIREEPASTNLTIMPSASLRKYLFVDLAIPNAIANVVINVVISAILLWGESELVMFSRTKPLFPDIIMSTFNSIVLTHLASIRLSSRHLTTIGMGFPPAKEGLAAFFGCGNSLLHRIRGGIVFGLLWAITAAIITLIIYAVFDIQKVAFGNFMKFKVIMAFSIGYIQSILSGYMNMRGRTLTRQPEDQ